jgi:hypothetical protein
MIMKHQFVQNLDELRLQIARLEEIKDSIDRMKQMLCTEGEFFDQSQSSQFFLGERLSGEVRTEDEPAVEGDIDRK